MVLQMKRAKPSPVVQFSVFVRGMRGHEAETQRDDCAAEAKRRGIKILNEYNGATPGDRDEWIKRLRGEKGDGAMLSGLYVLAEPASANCRPSADFVVALGKLLRNAAIVVDAESGISSEDGEAWDELVRSAINVVAGGRKMTSERGRKMRAKRKPGPSVKAEWSKPEMIKERERWEQFWRDPKFKGKGDEYVFLKMPAKVREMLKSPSMARRVFGPKRLGDPSAGGRGRKRKPRRKG